MASLPTEGSNGRKFREFLPGSRHGTNRFQLPMKSPSRIGPHPLDDNANAR